MLCERSIVDGRISVFGDSISTFAGFIPAQNKVYYEGDACERNEVERVEDTWWMQVIDALGGRLLANASFSGSLVAGESFPAGCSQERACQICGAEGERPGCVLVYMGINDYGEGTPLPVFQQAYTDMLANLSEQAPEAELLCLTLLPGRTAERDADFFREKYKGADLSAYNDAIRCIVREHGAHLVDVAAIGEPFETLDGTHPTKRGMDQLAATVLKAL